MKQTKFIFDFLFDDRKDDQRHCFIIDYPDDHYDILCNMSSEDEHLDFVSEMESDYGVHDFCTIGDEQIFGYNTYEVEPQNIPIVMEKWREYFIGKGYNCGSVFQEEIPEGEYVDLW